MASMTKCAIKTLYAGQPNNNNIYEIGSIIKSIEPHTAWYLFTFPVAWLATINGFAIAYINEVHIIILRNITVLSGTVFSQIVRIKSV